MALRRELADRDLQSRDTLTKKADASEAPTSADNSRQTRTDADRELVRISGRIARWQRDRLEAIAERDGRLLSDLVREAVLELIKKQEA